jgi:hypothetical protein
MFLKTSPVPSDWAGEPCIVAATGPSLTVDLIQKVRMARWVDKWKVIAVNDAYSVMPWADAMYACDNHWWLKAPRDFSKFAGELWTSHEEINHPTEVHVNDSREILKAFPAVRLVAGRTGSEFSFDPSYISYGLTSGFQAINLGLLKGCRDIILVGFDSRHVNGKSHFFGDHPKGIPTTPDHGYSTHVEPFKHAAARLPKSVRIINATPGSAIQCFPIMEFDKALDYFRFHWPHGVPDSHRTEPQAATG